MTSKKLILVYFANLGSMALLIILILSFEKELVFMAKDDPNMPYIAKLAYAQSEESKVAILGSSRIENIGNLRGIANLGNSGLSILGVEHALNFIINETNIKKVVIEVPYYSFQRNHRFNDHDIERFIERRNQLKWTFDYLIFLSKSVIPGLVKGKGHFEPTDKDKTINFLKSDIQIHIKGFEDKYIAILKRVRDKCLNSKIECVFFMGPFHPTFNYVEKLNVKGNLENFKAFIERVVEVVDFIFLDIFYFNDNKYFHNMGHFTPKAGRAIIFKILNKKFENMIIGKENLESLMEKIDAKSSEVNLKEKSEDYLERIYNNSLKAN